MSRCASRSRSSKDFSIPGSPSQWSACRCVRNTHSTSGNPTVRISCLCVPSPQSKSHRSPPRRTSAAGSPRRAVGTLPAVPAKNTDRSMVARGYFSTRRRERASEQPTATLRRLAPVAQWIERRPPEAEVAGSNPAGRACRSPLDAGRRMWRADRLGLRRPALAQVDRRGSPSSRPRGTRTASSAACGSRSPTCDVGRPRHGRRLVVELVGVVADAAGDRLGEPGGEPDRAHDEQQRVRVDPRAQAAGARPGGRVALRMLAEQLLLVALGTARRPAGLDSLEPFWSSQTVATM